MNENTPRPIVVGMDGSAAAQEALRWAVEDAKRRGCRVDVISAWNPDYGVFITPMAAQVALEVTPQALKTAAQAVLDSAVKDVEGVELRRLVVEGDPRTVLTKASEEAELLVVGSRGHGPIIEAILGSVSSHCVHHASCPVLVIREATVAQDEPAPETVAQLTPGPLL